MELDRGVFRVGWIELWLMKNLAFLKGAFDGRNEKKNLSLHMLIWLFSEPFCGTGKLQSPDPNAF